MQSRVPVRNRLRMIGVRRMEMLLWQNRGAHKPRRQGESDDRAAEPG